MNRTIVVMSVGVLFIGLLGYLGHRMQMATPGSHVRVHAELRARQGVSDWPEFPRQTAEMMIEKLGPPDRASQFLLQWNRRGPWKRVAVRRYAVDSPLEHVVEYRVPEERVGDVAWFGHGLSLNMEAGELAASSDSEALNLLCLNLAHEVAAGRRSIDEAHAVFSREAALAASGKSSPYMERLLFTPGSREPAGWKGATPYWPNTWREGAPIW